MHRIEDVRCPLTQPDFELRVIGGDNIAFWVWRRTGFEGGPDAGKPLGRPVTGLNCASRDHSQITLMFE